MADTVQDYTKKCCAPYMFGCPLYIHNTKKTCFVRIKGCPYAPIHLDAPYVWLPPICLDAAKCMVASKGMRDIQIYGGVQTYRGIQTYGGIQMYGGIWTPNQPDKACFLCVVYVKQAPKHLPNIWGIKTYGGIQTCGRVHTYSGNILTWGAQTYRELSNTYGASKHTGGASK